MPRENNLHIGQRPNWPFAVSVKIMYVGNFREKSKENYPVILNKISLPLFLTSNLLWIMFMNCIINMHLLNWTLKFRLFHNTIYMWTCTNLCFECPPDFIFRIWDMGCGTRGISLYAPPVKMGVSLGSLDFSGAEILLFIITKLI